MSGTFALYRYPCVTSASCTCHVLRGAAVSLEPAGSDPNPRCIHGIRDLVDGTGKKRHWSTVSASWWTGPEKSHICPRDPRSGGRSAVFDVVRPRNASFGGREVDSRRAVHEIAHLVEQLYRFQVRVVYLACI